MPRRQVWCRWWRAAARARQHLRMGKTYRRISRRSKFPGADKIYELKLLVVPWLVFPKQLCTCWLVSLISVCEGEIPCWNRETLEVLLYRRIRRGQVPSGFRWTTSCPSLDLTSQHDGGGDGLSWRVKFRGFGSIICWILLTYLRVAGLSTNGLVLNGGTNKSIWQYKHNETQKYEQQHGIMKLFMM